MGAHGEELIFVLLTVKSRRRAPEDLSGVTRQVVGRLLGGQNNLASVVGPATGSAVPGSKMSCGSPRNVIVAIRGRVPFAAVKRILQGIPAEEAVSLGSLADPSALRAFEVFERGDPRAR